MNAQTRPRIGCWILGVGGSIATHVLVGAFALRRGLTSAQGMVTARAPLTELPLCAPGELVFGGHELRPGPDPLAAARELADGRAGLRPELVEAVASDLEAVRAEIRPGCRAGLADWVTSLGIEPPDAVDPVEEFERLRVDLEGFRRRHALDRVVAVNLASTEPDVAPTPDLESADLTDFLARASVSSSVVFTAAALAAGCPVVNFTPSRALELAPLRALADHQGLPTCGRDGKTGETLLKSVLAPMFLARHLRVLSWESHNLLGNRDGAVLDHEQNRRSKLLGKTDLLEAIFDYPLHHRVHIDFVPSLQDWKTAWNLIHFEGFLGARMSLQFTWQGCDSALAAPLVLDLVRLTDLAHARGESGPMRHVGAFFKSPPAGTPPDFASQMELLDRYARS